MTGIGSSIPGISYPGYKPQASTVDEPVTQRAYPLNTAFVTGPALAYGVSLSSLPMIFLGCEDGGGSHSGLVTSVTIFNTGQYNSFGEFAMGLVESGTYHDTFAFATDPNRNKTENFKLRHRGIDILEVMPQDEAHGLLPPYSANDFVLHQKTVLNTHESVVLQATNNVGSAIETVIAVNEANELVLGGAGMFSAVGIYGGSGASIKLHNQVSLTDGLGAWGHAPPEAQPARPTTLEGVIAILVAYGLTA